MKKKYFLLFLIPFLILLSCVDGNYDPEGRWELNAQKADDCEENDSFDTAFEPSQIDLLYLNFYDDLIDYYLYSFIAGRTYTLTADVPFEHLSDTTINVYNTAHDMVVTSTAPSEDNRDSVIEGFTAEADSYYVLVVNTSSSGTGPLRGYMLTIEEE